MAVRRPLVLVAGKKKELPVGDVLPLAALAAVVSDTLTDGVLDVAPSQNAVFDALAGKASLGVSVSFGDVTTLRPSSPTTGYQYFGNTNARYIGWDGTNFVINVVAGQGNIWHTQNFNPATKAGLEANTYNGNQLINGAVTSTTGFTTSLYGESKFATGNAFGRINHAYYGITDFFTFSANYDRTGASTGVIDNASLGTAEIMCIAANADGGRISFRVGEVNTAPSEIASITRFGLLMAGPIRLKDYTVATLPAGTQGDTAFVTDATAPTWNAALVGGGAVVCPSFRNATAWVSA